jgi:hypothetical protein
MDSPNELVKELMNVAENTYTIPVIGTSAAFTRPEYQLINKSINIDK